MAEAAQARRELGPLGLVSRLCLGTMMFGGATDAGEAREIIACFAEAGGTFRISDGVLTNEDFALRAPVLRITGGGTVNLGAQTLDYRLLPRVAGTL